MGVIEPGLGVVQLQDAVVVVGGVPLDQVQLPLSALEHGVVGDEPPLVVVGPSLHLAAHRAGEVIGGAQVVHVVVQPHVVAVVLGPPARLRGPGSRAVLRICCVLARHTGGYPKRNGLSIA